jgi:hypothetical protein
MSSAITIGVVSAAVSAYSAYNAKQNADAANARMDTVAGKQNYYNQQLMTLMQQPEEFFNNPLYTSARDQGLKATERQMAAGGFNGSGNMMQELMKYGQSFGMEQLLNQEKLLAPLTGATQNILEGQKNVNDAQANFANEASSSMGAFGSLSQQIKNKWYSGTTTSTPTASAAAGDFYGSQSLNNSPVQQQQVLGKQPGSV